MDSAKKKATTAPKTQKKGPKKPKKITPDYLHNAGLYYLQRFSASRQHFRTVLMRKVKKSCYEHKDQNYEDCAALVEETVQKFERAGLLNDELYTQGVVNSLRRQGKSKKVIVMKLQTRGISQDLAAEKLEAVDSEKNGDADLIAAIMVTRKKKAGAFGNRDPEKTLAALARAGFSYDIAKKALEMSREDAEDLLNG